MKFYRYDTEYYSYLDEYENILPSHPTLKLTEFFLAKETPKCWRIAYDWDTNLKYTKLVRKNARKKYAWPTKEEAAKSLLARKKKYVDILIEKLDNARMELNIAIALNDKQ
jgi:hypothetical protein